MNEMALCLSKLPSFKRKLLDLVHNTLVDPHACSLIRRLHVTVRRILRLDGNITVKFEKNILHYS